VNQGHLSQEWKPQSIDASRLSIAWAQDAAHDLTFGKVNKHYEH
jgi:hypothetical protein